MTKEQEKLLVQRILATAEITTALLGRMSSMVSEYRIEGGINTAEIEEALGTTNAALQIWRLEIGEQEGVLKIKPVPDWEDDEFD